MAYPDADRRALRNVLLVVVAIWVAVFALRLAAPSNMVDNDQFLSASYVIDITENGAWLVQRDAAGDIASKPPLHPWLCAIAAIVTGGVSEFSLRLPSALAVLGVAVLIVLVGRARFGLIPSAIGAAALLLSPMGIKQVALVRTDPLFGLLVFGTAIGAFLAWESGRGWMRVWIIAALATITKGPLVVVLGALGLLAAWWEKRSGRPLPVRGGHIAGVAVFVLIAGGWFALAWADAGRAFIDKVIFDELLGHAVTSPRGDFPGTKIYRAPLYLMARFLPWSVFAAIAVWRVFRDPSPDDSARRLERFLTCYMLGGMVLFGLAPHMRPDIIYPLIPAAAMLAGREVERLVHALRPRTTAALAVLTLAGVLGGAYAYYHHQQPKHPRIARSLEMRTLIDDLRARFGPHVGADPEIVFVDDTPGILQHYLRVRRTRVTHEHALTLLAEDPDRRLVAVVDAESLATLWTLRGAPGRIETLLTWRAEDGGQIQIARLVPATAEHDAPSRHDAD